MIINNLLAKEQFMQILNEKRISSVYQPIVSLSDGDILGYEGLSRIDLDICEFNTEEMFQISESLNKVWELEELCRIQTLKNAADKPKGKKLFVNVDPKVIHDEKFINGITAKYLKVYGLTPEDIVFEITEKSSIEDADAFEKTIKHYKEQAYQIAIDDFGNGFAGLRRVCSLPTNYLKIDMSIVRDIDKDETKRTLVESFVLFCESTSIGLIAEGIETVEELETLIQLGVLYGQGYYLGRPATKICEISNDVKTDIIKFRMRHKNEISNASFFGNIGSICNEKYTVGPDCKGYQLFEYFYGNVHISEICVINDEKEVLGMISRSKFLEKFSSRFGYSLFARKNAKDLQDRNPLIIDAMTSVEQVSKLALEREDSSLYDSVVVTHNNRYIGVVTVKNLLETAISIQVTMAVDVNPLTKMPGNTAIEKEVNNRITSNAKYGLIYLDIDNFKAYNDLYGFNNGDLMIKAAAECICESCKNSEFMGHIGGDDFIIVTAHWDLDQLCRSIIDKFSNRIKKLYTEEDIKNGNISSTDRSGNAAEFGIATLSMAVVTNRYRNYQKYEEISKELAFVKKRCKQINGNVIIGA